MRKEIKNAYGTKVGQSYNEDLKRARSRRSDPEGRRLQRYGESEVKGYQRRAASSKNTKVDKEAMKKIEKSVNVKYKSSKGSKLPQLAKQVKKVSTLAKLNPTTLAVGVLAEKYGAMLINKGVDAVYKKLSKELGKAPTKAQLNKAKTQASKKRKGRNQ
jgi:phage-related protein